MNEKVSSSCNHENDYISRQAAIDALKNRWKKTRNYEGIGDDIAEECELYLKQLPSAQPDLSSYSDKLWHNAYERGRAEAEAEIVRCKDCKWYELPSHKITENCVRWMKSNGILLPIKPNDYCSYAERRTDGNGRD